MKELIVKHFLDYEFVYAFLFVSLTFLFVTVFIKLKIIKKVSILLFSIFFVLFGFEFTLSFFMEHYILVPDNTRFFNVLKEYNITKNREIFLLNEKNNTPYRIMSKSNEEIERIEKQYIDKGYKKIYDNTFSTYSNNIRYTESNPNGKKAYIFLGGSFTWGSCLDDKETLPYYFSMLNNFEDNILNLGVSGKGTNCALNILNSNMIGGFISEDKQITRFVYSLIGDHIFRNFEMLFSLDSGKGFCSGGTDPWIKENNQWKFTADHPYKKLKLLFIRSYLFRKIFVKKIEDMNIQYYEKYLLLSLKKMNEIIENKYKSKLTIIVWPECIGKNFGKQLQSLNLDLILLSGKFHSEELGYRIKYDGHPTAKANEEIAKILYNHINSLE